MPMTCDAENCTRISIVEARDHGRFHGAYCFGHRNQAEGFETVMLPDALVYVLDELTGEEETAMEESKENIARAYHDGKAQGFQAAVRMFYKLQDMEAK